MFVFYTIISICLEEKNCKKIKYGMAFSDWREFGKFILKLYNWKECWKGVNSIGDDCTVSLLFFFFLLLILGLISLSLSSLFNSSKWSCIYINWQI